MLELQTIQMRLKKQPPTTPSKNVMFGLVVDLLKILLSFENRLEKNNSIVLDEFLASEIPNNKLI